MNNQSVAWRIKDKNSEWLYYDDEVVGAEPLYAQPQKYCPSEDNAAYEKGFVDGMGQMIESAVHRAVEGMSAKTLTDEEIQEVAHGFGAIGWMGDITYEFARAILKKAQEK